MCCKYEVRVCVVMFEVRVCVVMFEVRVCVAFISCVSYECAVSICCSCAECMMQVCSACVSNCRCTRCIHAICSSAIVSVYSIYDASVVNWVARCGASCFVCALGLARYVEGLSV